VDRANNVEVGHRRLGQGSEVTMANGKVTGYKVILKVTFIVSH
jgi:hypothetical protein